MVQSLKDIFLIIGLLGLGLFIMTVIITTIMAHAWFNWYINALSDLGHPTKIGGMGGDPGVNPTAIYFNMGLSISGLLLALSVFGLIRNMGLDIMEEENRGILLLAINSISLIFVGIFNESIIWPHIIAALTFFLSLIIGALLFGYNLYTSSKDSTIGLLSILLGILSLLGMFVFPVILSQVLGNSFGIGSGIHEAAIFLPGLLWIILVFYTSK